METIKDLLQGHEFFSGLTPADIELVSGCGKNVHFRAGEQIFRENDSADEFYLVRRGSASLDMYVPQHGPVTIESIGPGELLGVSWLFPPYRWAFDARATDELSAVSIDANCLRQKCEEDPHLGYELMKRVALIFKDRLQATRIRLIDIYNIDSGPK